MSELRQRNDIDGLRTLAVVPVVLFHAGISSFGGGFVGVDIFFVISGYLITGILFRQIQGGRFSIIEFYERRARRILPALFALMAIIYFVGLLILSPHALSSLSASIVAAALFSSNILFWYKSGGYFADDVETELMLHTWSLGVEEQFYIFFPLLLWALARWRGAGALKWGVGLVCAASFILSVCLTSNHPEANFYLLPTRVWELGIGALLALGMFPGTHRTAIVEAVATLGFVGIFCAIFFFNHATPFPGVTALLPCLGALALLWAGMQRRTVVARLLETGPMVFIGKISYSFYLWHWPVLVYFRLRAGGEDISAQHAVLAIAIAFVCAVLSYRYVEQPFRNRSSAVFTRKVVLAGAVTGIGLFTMGGATTYVQKGFPARIPEVPRLVYATRDEFRSSKYPSSGGMSQLGKPGSGDPLLLLWGDSHAGTLFTGFDDALSRKGISGTLSFKNACAPLLGVERIDEDENCAASNDKIIAMLRETDDYRAVVLSARWTLNAEGYRAKGERGRTALLRGSGESDHHDPAKNFVYFEAGLRRTIDEIKKTGRLVIVINDTPEIGWSVPEYLGNHLFWNAKLPEPPDLAAVEARRQRVDALFAELDREGKISLFDPVPLFCTPVCAIERNGKPLFHDDDHLSITGNIVVEPLIEEVIDAAESYAVLPGKQASLRTARDGRASRTFDPSGLIPG